MPSLIHSSSQIQHDFFTNRPVIWSIAGSDCSGGAGIQADVKTAQALNCETCTFITANTVQNSQRVMAINPVEVEVLQQQYEALINDKPPAAVKIGLVVNNAQISWLINTINTIKQQYPLCHFVYDPVLKATVGNELTSEAIDTSLLQQLIQTVDVITPNMIEAQMLTHHASNSAKELALSLKKLGVKHTLITGGHNVHNDGIDNEIVDLLMAPDINYELISKRLENTNNHGSGCTQATALACFMAHGYLVRDAFMQSKAFINKAFALSQLPDEIKAKNGALIQPQWPVEKQFYPKVSLVDFDAPEAAFASCKTTKLGLYPVIDSIEWLEKLLPFNLEVIQLRLKNKTEHELDELIAKAVEVASHYNTRLFINDFWQLAIKHGAYGVHLGQEDLVDADLKAIQAAGLRLGLSTHGCYEFRLAEQLRPSYLAIGAIFETQTKDMTGQIQGVNNLANILAIQEGEQPVVAIGGITLDNVNDVLSTGVQSIAVVTAITKQPDTQKVVTTWQSFFK